jgi:hypothetical protein
MANYGKYDLTPTEELMMEVLIARHRLGEPWWTFSGTPGIRRAANSLQDKGLVGLMSPQVERTFRADLTAEGLALLDDDYIAPILRKGHGRNTSRTFTITVVES